MNIICTPLQVASTSDNLNLEHFFLPWCLLADKHNKKRVFNSFVVVYSEGFFEVLQYYTTTQYPRIILWEARFEPTNLCLRGPLSHHISRRKKRCLWGRFRQNVAANFLSSKKMMKCQGYFFMLLPGGPSPACTPQHLNFVISGFDG